MQTGQLGTDPNSCPNGIYVASTKMSKDLGFTCNCLHHPRVTGHFVVVGQSLSCVPLFLTPWSLACQAPVFTISQSLLKLMFIESVMLSNHFILCHPTPPALSLSQHQDLFLFASGGQSIGTSASASVLLMNIQLISFRINWFDLLAVQRTLKSLLQHYNLKVSGQAI